MRRTAAFSRNRWFKVASISKEFSRLIQTRHFNGVQRAMEFARMLLERPMEIQQLPIKMPAVVGRGTVVCGLKCAEPGIQCEVVSNDTSRPRVWQPAWLQPVGGWPVSGLGAPTPIYGKLEELTQQAMVATAGVDG